MRYLIILLLALLVLSYETLTEVTIEEEINVHQEEWIRCEWAHNTDDLYYTIDSFGNYNNIESDSVWVHYNSPVTAIKYYREGAYFISNKDNDRVVYKTIE